MQIHILDLCVTTFEKNVMLCVDTLYARVKVHNQALTSQENIKQK